MSKPFESLAVRSLGRWTAVLLTVCLSAATMAQQLEQGVKAAFIYNFTKYVEWPAGSLDNSNNIVIGIVGQDSLGGALEKTIEGKTAGGRKFVVRHFRWGQDLSQCNVLFVPAGEMGSAALLAHIKDRPVLTIGEAPGFARRDGIINFVIESNHVRFEINAQAAQGAGLAISSKLLALGKPPGE